MNRFLDFCFLFVIDDNYAFSRPKLNENISTVAGFISAALHYYFLVKQVFSSS